MSYANVLHFGFNFNQIQLYYYLHDTYKILYAHYLKFEHVISS